MDLWLHACRWIRFVGGAFLVKGGIQHVHCHIAMTYGAMASLAILGDPLEIDADAIVKGVLELQRKEFFLHKMWRRERHALSFAPLPFAGCSGASENWINHNRVFLSHPAAAVMEDTRWCPDRALGEATYCAVAALGSLERTYRSRICWCDGAMPSRAGWMVASAVAATRSLTRATAFGSAALYRCCRSRPTSIRKS